MRHVFLDASAVVKRYLSETGSDWLRSVTDPDVANDIILAEITLAEVSAAFARRERMPDGGITRLERDQLLTDFLDHCSNQYSLTTVDRPCIDRAVVLAQRHPLRGYDAVQLGTALAANAALVAAGLPDLVFVAADNDLLTAAAAEGLAVENPNRYA